MHSITNGRYRVLGMLFFAYMCLNHCSGGISTETNSDNNGKTQQYLTNYSVVQTAKAVDPGDNDTTGLSLLSKENNTYSLPPANEVINKYATAHYSKGKIKFGVGNYNLYVKDGKWTADLPIASNHIVSIKETADTYILKHKNTYNCVEESGTDSFSIDELAGLFEHYAAMKCEDNGKFEEALSGYAEAAKLHPNIDESFFGMARCLTRLGLHNEAVSVLLRNADDFSVSVYFRLYQDPPLKPLLSHPKVKAFTTTYKGTSSFTLNSQGISKFGIAHSKEKGLLAVISRYNSWGIESHTDYLDIFDEKTGTRLIRKFLFESTVDSIDTENYEKNLKEQIENAKLHLKPIEQFMCDMGFSPLDQKEIIYAQKQSLNNYPLFKQTDMGIVAFSDKWVIIKNRKPVLEFPGGNVLGNWVDSAYISKLDTIVAWTHVDEPEGCRYNGDIALTEVLPLSQGKPYKSIVNQNTQETAADERPADRIISKLFLGSSHFCALRKNGQLICYGSNEYGQMGDDAAFFEKRLYYSNSKKKGLHLYYPLNMTEIVDAAMGEAYSCALKKDRTVWCWGQNLYAGFISLVPVKMNIPVRISSLSGSNNSMCAVAEDGTVWCWGDMKKTNLQNLSKKSETQFFQMPKLLDIESISIGNSHSCAVDKKGKLFCWGYNFKGQLGTGTTKDSHLPVQVKDFNNVSKVSVGGSHTCAGKKDGTWWCFGQGNYSVLSDGLNSTDKTLPLQIEEIDTVQQIASGKSHTCVLRQGGTVWCIGSGSRGCPGKPYCSQDFKPYLLENVDSVLYLAASEEIICVVKHNGTVWCAGNNRDQKLVPKNAEYLESMTLVSALR